MNLQEHIRRILRETINDKGLILSSDKGIEKGYEFIEDGWHRFHSYVDKGITNIPVIKFV